jgi:hypothetical protein
MHKRRRGTTPPVDYGMRVVNGQVLEGEVVDMRRDYGMARVPSSNFEPAPSVAFPTRPFRAPQQAAVAATKPVAAPVAAGDGGSGGGFGVADFLKAPFRLAGAAGSLVLAGINKAGNVAQKAYVKHRVNGHSVLGDQVTHHANEVVRLSGELRRQGMGEVVDAIRSTGAPPHEVFAGMGPGGKYENIGQKYDKLMANPDAAATFAKMQEHISAFDRTSERYAKAGMDLDVDYAGPIQAGAEAMMNATEGMPIKEGSGFKHLQDKLHEMTQKIIEMVERIFRRFVPA